MPPGDYLFQPVDMTGTNYVMGHIHSFICKQRFFRDYCGVDQPGPRGCN